ncbi:MAG: pyridoxal-phosphate dependent enzyme [Woeseiaceae bacterium]|nr:pyridoxal-phosphate dependent enzyme [Woeseiaceae bacterium]
MGDPLTNMFPVLAQRLPKTQLANLPTPVSQHEVSAAGRSHSVAVKHDDVTAELYGGNKVRKLEFLLRRASDKNAKRIATFGTVASNHALATALYARSLGFECTCFLSHQTKTPNCARALNTHLINGTEIVRLGGKRTEIIATLRRYLHGREAWVLPPGGSSWLGVIGFVNAGLELADQVNAGELPEPDRLYVANGTMATASGLALGLALAGLRTDVQAIRVTHEFMANRLAMQSLIRKTGTLMHMLDASVPGDLASRVNLSFRDEFFGGGYARSNESTDRAVELAKAEFGITLETTYTGKAMAALLHDLDRSAGKVLFWNTYNSRPLPAGTELPDDTGGLPREFLRYYD